MKRLGLFFATCALACTPSVVSTKPGDGTGGGIVLGTGGGPAGLGGAIAPPPIGGPSDAGVVDRGGPMGPPLSEFTRTEKGGYKLGGPAGMDPGASGMAGASAGCMTIVGVVRDFKGLSEYPAHPDFESFQGDLPTTGLVAAMIGPDNKPVYASRCEAGSGRNATCPFGRMTTSKMAFDQWYRPDPINKPYVVYFLFDTDAQTRVSTFASSFFFPLDGAGWGNSGNDVRQQRHNFGFTTELHMKFKYNGGETFTFTGDDDLWVFVNGRLAMDLGGLHPPATGTITLDTDAGKLGLEKGGTYPISLFHAERHTAASNFRVDTNLAFTDCGAVVD